MKKLFSIALSLLMLLSCFVFSVSAEGVNVALNATYYFDVPFDDPNSFGNPPGLTDLNGTILTDGVVPNNYELKGETVGLTGTGKVYTLTVDLGAVYSDITDINFLCVNDALGDCVSNRGFSGEDTIFLFSADGTSFKRNKDFTMSRVDMDGNDKTTFYNFCFKFDSPVTAQKIQMVINGGTNKEAAAELGYIQGYVISMGEVEVISASGVGSAPVEPESSEEESIDEPDESEDEPVESDGPATSDAESEAASTEESEAASAEESKAEESKAEESKAETSKEETSKPATSSEANGGDDGGISPVVIIVIIVAVVAVAAVVVIVVKKKK